MPMNFNDLLLDKEDVVISHHNSDAFNIVFTTDRKYAKFTGVSIYSVIKNNEKSYINFHIFVSEMNKVDIELLRNLKTDYINITLYYLNAEFFQSFHTCGHFSYAVYYRLCIPNILNNTKKILYLDVDTICLGDISQLFDVELNESIIGVVEDANVTNEHLSEISFERNECYFNSGVLLINTEKWNLNNTFLKLVDLISNRRFSYPDQDALNLLLKDKKYVLPEKFNWTNWYKTPEILKLRSEGIIFAHFIGEIKPWHEIGFNAVYDYFKMASPWKNEAYLKPETTKMFGRYSRAYWRKGNYIMFLKYQFIYIVRKMFSIK